MNRYDKLGYPRLIVNSVMTLCLATRLCPDFGMEYPILRLRYSQPDDQLIYS